jgi:hypothetical protein
MGCLAEVVSACRYNDATVIWSVRLAQIREWLFIGAAGGLPQEREKGA